MIPDLPPEVSAALAALPAPARTALIDARKAVFETARRVDAGPLTETLKWGQPAYLTHASKSGTTVRLGLAEDQPAVLVHCQTTLIDGFRAEFPGAFTYSGNRALLLTPGHDRDALALFLGRALTYHRNKGGRK